MRGLDRNRVLEPGGLNVERVRASPHGNECPHLGECPSEYGVGVCSSVIRAFSAFEA